MDIIAVGIDVSKDRLDVAFIPVARRLWWNATVPGSSSWSFG